MVLEKIGMQIQKSVATCSIKAQNKLLKIQTKLGKKITKSKPDAGKNFEPIMSTELNTIKQMTKFNKTALGVKVFDVKDKELGKFLTDGMTDFYNKTGGQFKVPRNIIVCDLPNSNGFMMYEQTKDILAISKKHIDKFQEIAKENGETLEQILKKWGQTKFDGTATAMYEKGLFKELFHEFGHKAHSIACKNYGNLGLDWSKTEFQDIAAKVSKYSKESPEEFVAETFSLLVQGKQLPKDVLQLYEKCGGPIVKTYGSSGGGGGIRNIITDFIEQNGHAEANFADLMLVAKYSKQFPSITVEQAKVLEIAEKTIMNSKVDTQMLNGNIGKKIAIEA